MGSEAYLEVFRGKSSESFPSISAKTGKQASGDTKYGTLTAIEEIGEEEYIFLGFIPRTRKTVSLHVALWEGEKEVEEETEEGKKKKIIPARIIFQHRTKAVPEDQADTLRIDEPFSIQGTQGEFYLRGRHANDDKIQEAIGQTNLEV